MTALQPTAYERGLRSPEDIVGPETRTKVVSPHKKRQRVASEFEDGPQRQEVANLALSKRTGKKALADEIGANPACVSDWCRGRRRVPDHHIANLEAIAYGRA